MRMIVSDAHQRTASYVVRPLSRARYYVIGLQCVILD